MSLDAFRGLTIAGMVLVNNPGSWGKIYAPLEHAQWDGWTPTDFVFPFFLYIMGVAMTFSFDKRLNRGDSKLRLFEQVVRRSIILYLLALIAGWMFVPLVLIPYIMILAGISFIYMDEPILGFGTSPKTKRNKMIGWGLVGAAIVWLASYYFQTVSKDPEQTRIIIGRVPGVLARISLCYLCASVIMLNTKLWGRVAWTLFLINIYWLIMKYIHAPAGFAIADGPGLTRDAPMDAPFPGDLNAWIDLKLFGSHLYSHRPDPEGLLSTIPAIATVLCGVLTGMFLHTDRSRHEKALIMFVAGNVLIIAGACMDMYFPINKKIWSSSYVIFCAGWALALLAPCYYIIDVKGYKKWSVPLQVFGTNAILVFVASGMMARIMGRIKFDVGGNTMSLKGYLYNEWFLKYLGPGDAWFQSRFGEPELASLGFAICFVLFWLIVTYPLYKKQIFLKV